MIKVCFSIVILLFLATYCNGQADCNCPSDISKFKDSAYFNSFYKDFKISCLTDQFIINKEENKAINQIINNLNAVKGSPAEVGNAIKLEIANLLTLLKNLDKYNSTKLEQMANKAAAEVENVMSIICWRSYLSCQVAQVAKDYYTRNPTEAPVNHQQHYSNPNKNDLIQSNLSYSGFMLLGAVLGAILASVLISLLIFIKFYKRKTSKSSIQNILDNHLFIEWFDKRLLAFQSLVQENEILINELSSQKKKFSEFDEIIKKLDKKIAKDSGVDTDKLDKLLNDLRKRVKNLEDLPVRRENLTVVLEPEDFLNFIQKNPKIKEAVKEGLDIVQIRDLITKMLPHPLNNMELGDLDSETFNRYWRIYKSNPEFLPAFKADIIKAITSKK